MLALTRVAAPRGGIARGVARLLCAPSGGEPARRPVPRGFERFFPPGARDVPASGAVHREPPRHGDGPGKAKTAASGPGGGSGGPGGSGPGGPGGGPKRDKDGPRSPSLTELLMAAGGGLLLASAFDWSRLLGFDSSGGAGARREISFQQFLAQVLPSGRVRRLVVVNGSQVCARLAPVVPAAARAPRVPHVRVLAPNPGQAARACPRLGSERTVPGSRPRPPACGACALPRPTF